MKSMDIRTERKRRGLTQEEFSELAGIHQTTLSNIELGRVRRPSYDIMEKIAAAFGVDPRVLSFPDNETQEVA